MDEVNPYASPRSAETALPPPEPAATFAWRDGDTLLLRRKGAVLPRACLKSNRSKGVRMHEIVTFSDTWARLMLLLFLVPFAGFFVAVAVMSLLVHIGRAARTQLWFRRRIIALLAVFDLLTTGALLAGNSLTGCALLWGNVGLFVVGLACSAVGVGLAFALQLLGYLRSDLVHPDLVRIREVHPDYLKRLPRFDAREPAESN